MANQPWGSYNNRGEDYIIVFVPVRDIKVVVAGKDY